MKNEILNIFKENLVVKISFIFILFFPIILLVGSSVVNLSIVIMNIFFLIHIFKEKKLKIFNNEISYFLFALWTFLIINTFLNNNFIENYERSFGFVRFILLVLSFSYFFSYKKFQYKSAILNMWGIIFIIVSLDLIFEFFFGFNTLGFSSAYDGRLAGFMGDELKIGHWYLCFSLILLSNNFNQNKGVYFFIIFSIIISFFIGERANFIRLFIGIFAFIIITRRLSLKNYIFFIAPFFIFALVLNNVKDDSKKIGKFDVIKDRYITEFFFMTKHDSFTEFNNSNKYTPMFVNAYTVFKENKLLGVGLGSYYEKSHEVYRAHRFRTHIKMMPNTHPHQHHFEILALVGLPGYIFLFSFLLYFLKKSFFFYLTDKKIINLSSMLIVLVFCVPLLPTGSFFTTYGAAIFWLNFSLMNLGNFKNINY